ncbi:TetR/AcrR family transcriptional regulator [Microlunatus sp. GCM10028923]|uniref:TetR/AcrR family transcriptional regulator n=1 Tax=Microlunatus sp. GCM10028923 TaxID=3273400 RepID=UPI003607DE11
MARQPALQDRIATGILDAAAAVLAERGLTASMGEIAAAAGVGRATLYRYFPNRDALLEGLIQAATAELTARVAAADLDAVSVEVALGRLARAFLTAGAKYAVLASVDKKGLGSSGELEAEVRRPVRDLIDRGLADGTFRAEVGADVLLGSLAALLEHGLARVMAGDAGIESVGDSLVDLYLNGASAR